MGRIVMAPIERRRITLEEFLALRPGESIRFFHIKAWRDSPDEFQRQAYEVCYLGNWKGRGRTRLAALEDVMRKITEPVV